MKAELRMDGLSTLRQKQDGNWYVGIQNGKRDDNGKDRWINVEGEQDALKRLRKGDKIYLDNMKQTKQGFWWANLAPMPQNGPAPAQDGPPPQPTGENALESKPAAQNGKITLSQWLVAMGRIHAMATSLEPDDIKEGIVEGSVVKLDRSTARAAILNTCCIAMGRGDFVIDEVKPEDEVTPF